ncbi:hypothetical protein M438DRAFT_356126 [Aureobasidium pullulans EXF-150]|uniref:F-box domain-containing protein n=1 Tax=Aureobasidium pullulans EXF-150 TaxID=1043002 RepID=A0A074XDD3_AURPU|nr:uncharacterized protein M438DRAFT_356126 [Aureobasidium pullulans EXF-150]KEQ83428.1 hypothetical protein M438DRAFT_356126 [Aureobasidium pullulans EXF-150]
MASLLDLPIEVLQLVLDNINCESLAYLRLVCKKAYYTATPTFGRKYLGTIHPVLFSECLEALVEISKNHILRHYVKSILFVSYALKQGSCALQVVVSQHRPETSEWLIRRHQDCSDHQLKLVESGRHIELIAEALTNFKNAQIPLNLGIFDLELNNSDKIPIGTGWGAELFYGELLELDIWTTDGGNVLNTVITAANSCEYPLEAIEIDACACMTVPMGMGRQLTADTPQVDRLLTDLLLDGRRGNSKFSVCVKTTPTSDSVMTSQLRIEWPERRLIFQSLQRARETLLARFKYNTGLGLLATVLKTNTFSEIELSHCVVETYTLAKFIQNHARTLQQLKLSHIVFRKDRRHRREYPSFSARRFLTFLRDNLKSLEYLEICDIISLEPPWPSGRSFVESPKLTGRKEIVSTINSWLERMTS